MNTSNKTRNVLYSMWIYDNFHCICVMDKKCKKKRKKNHFSDFSLLGAYVYVYLHSFNIIVENVYYKMQFLPFPYTH